MARIRSPNGEELRGEAHFGQLLKILAESGLPVTATVETASGWNGSIADVLQDTILRFSLAEELEFVSDALVLWLPPAQTWSDRFGEAHDFNEVTNKLLDESSR